VCHWSHIAVCHWSQIGLCLRIVFVSDCFCVVSDFPNAFGAVQTEVYKIMMPSSRQLVEKETE